MWLPIKKLVLLHHFVIDVVRLSLIKLMVQTICGYRWGFSNNRFKPDLKLNFCIESKHDWVVLGDAHKTLHIYLS